MKYNPYLKIKFIPKDIKDQLEKDSNYYKHDFHLENGIVSFNIMGEPKTFEGFGFITWLLTYNFKKYFEYIAYNNYDSILFVFMDKTIKSMNKKTKEITKISKFPLGLKPYIISIKPNINNPIEHIEEYLNNEYNNLKKKIVGYDDYINESWIKKGILAGALATSSLSGYTQQKIDKFIDYQNKKTIEHTFNSPDEVNKWLKSNLDTNTTWQISKMEVIGDTKLHIKFNADKSKDGFNIIVFTCNKQTLKEEDKSVTKVLAKNPSAEVIYSGSYFTLNGIDYDWYLIGINTGTAVKYTPNISKTDNNNKPSKDINKPDVKKGLIDAHAYAAIYKFETTKGRIVKGSDGKYKATTMEANGITYDVHQKDNVIKNHIENAIGLDTWFKIPPKFRMQIFSYMFNSDSYEDKKGDRFRWLAGLAQSVNPSEFGTDTTGRRKIMKDENVRGEAIKYIKGLSEEDFVKAYDKYLEILRSQYASLSTDYGKAYDDAAKELSWFKRPIELEKYYGK